MEFSLVGAITPVYLQSARDESIHCVGNFEGIVYIEGSLAPIEKRKFISMRSKSLYQNMQK